MQYMPILILQKDGTKQELQARLLAKELLQKDTYHTPDFAVILPIKKHLGIEDIIHMRTQLKYKPYESTVRCIFIPNMQYTTTEAQNAMLKMLEETTENVQIFLGANNYKKLLPTLLSRCTIVKNANTPDEAIATNEFASNFLSQPIAKQMEYIQILCEKEKEEIEDFLLTLSSYLKTQMLKTKDRAEQKRYAAIVQEVIRANKYLTANVNNRVVLENIALFLYNE